MKRDYLPKQNKVISRKRLDDLFSVGMKYPVVMLVAGAGYGKTTAMESACRKTKCRLIWMRLLTVDNDTNRFWLRFADAAGYEVPELADAISSMDFPDTLGNFDSFLHIMAKQLQRDPEIVFVLDNAENLEDGPIRRFLDGLIKAELENLFFIISSRERLDLPRQLGESKYFSIGAKDLQFTLNETKQLFQLYKQQTEDNELERLVDNTDGWPLVLTLIAIQPGPRIQNWFEETTCVKLVSELFELNYFAAFDVDIQVLLIKLSYLGSIPLGLLRAVSPIQIERVTDILSKNAFVFYDYSSGVYHFQKLYRDFFIKKQAALSTDEWRDFYVAAGNWYVQNGFFREALECFWDACDYESFIDVVSILPLQGYEKGQTNWVLDKLNQFPDEYDGSHDALEYFKGLMYLHDMRLQKAKDIMLQISGRLESAERDVKQDVLLGNVYAALVDISFYQNDFTALDYIQKAIPLLPEGISNHAEKTMSAGNNEIFFLPCHNSGYISDAVAFIQEFDDYAKKLYDNRGRGYLLLFTAEAAYYSGNLDDAWENAVKAIYTAKDAMQYDIMVNAMYLQMRILLFQGDCVRAKSTLGEIQGAVNDFARTTLTSLRDCAEAFYYLRVNDAGKVPRWLTGTCEYSSDIPLDRGRDRLICALSLSVAGDYMGAYSTLLELGEIFEEHKIWGIEINAWILMAACQVRMKNENKAIQLFWRAYDMAWQNEITICFSEYGEVALDLLDLAVKQNEVSFDIEWTKRVRKETEEYIKREAAMRRIYGSHRNTAQIRTATSLSSREKEVLMYLAQGFMRDDIVDAMGISIHGVKKHISNIYSKLGAVNRADAVYIAMANGVVEEPTSK